MEKEILWQMTIRKFAKEDRQAYISMSEEFYNSGAVLHPVNGKNFEKTFSLLLSGNPLADGYIAEENGEAAGYALLAFSWSNEGGGLTVWLEEIYVRPKFQCRGIGRSMISRILHKYGAKAARFRLEAESSNVRAINLYKRIGFRRLPYMQMMLEPPFPCSD